jgi:hypothetical protein
MYQARSTCSDASIAAVDWGYSNLHPARKVGFVAFSASKLGCIKSLSVVNVTEVDAGKQKSIVLFNVKA